MLQKGNRYRNYLRLEVLVVLLVMACFRLVPDKKIASLIASSLFIVSTLGIMYWERTHTAEYQKRPTFWGATVFLLFSVLPIFFLRLIYWDMPFDEIQVAGVTGAQMHKASNYVFIVLLICLFVDSYMERLKSAKSA